MSDEMVIVKGPEGWQRFFTLAYWRMLLTLGKPWNIVQTVDIKVDPESPLGKRLAAMEEAGRCSE